MSHQNSWTGVVAAPLAELGPRLLAIVLPLATFAVGLPALGDVVFLDPVIDSGLCPSPGSGSEPQVLSSVVIDGNLDGRLLGARWMRLHFTDATSLGDPGEDGAFIRLASLKDAAEQDLDSFALAQWEGSPAYFNVGESDTAEPLGLRLELWAYPNTGSHRIVVDRVSIGGVAPARQDPWGPSGTDNRVPSNDPRAGRFMYRHAIDSIKEAYWDDAACSAFLIDNKGFLCAGHCCAWVIPSPPDDQQFPPVVQFNVPLSLPGGILQHPGPEDQYPVDMESIQANGFDPGTDWCYFGAFDNTTTGQSALRTQGASYQSADEAPTETGQTASVSGYGIHREAQHPGQLDELNQTQMTSIGEYEGLEEDFSNPEEPALTIMYTTYSISGNSGSPVYDPCAGLVYGIATHGGRGTAIHHPYLLAAVADPQGVCADCNHNGIPDPCDLDCGPPGGDCDVPGCGGSLDCTENGVPDECEPDCNNSGFADSCDLDQGASTDINGNSIPDECELLMDQYWDRDVDLADFAAFQACYGSSENPCICYFDHVGVAGVDLDDYLLLESELTGPGIGRGDGGAPAPPRSGGGRSSAPAPSPAPWQHEEAPIGLEVQPVGGGAPVTVLRPGTSYEVHYQADYVGVHGYVLFAVGTSPEVGFTEVQPADDGSWAETGTFRSYDLIKDLGVVMPAFGFPEGYYRYDLVSDRGPGLPEGQLCTFTTGSCGELHLHLYAWWIDESALFLAGMETQGGFIVAEE